MYCLEFRLNVVRYQ